MNLEDFVIIWSSLFGTKVENNKEKFPHVCST